jgi:hypothetical protein
MRRLERRSDGWTALAALLVVVVGGGGIAAAVSAAGADHVAERSVLTAAGVTDAEGAPPATSSTTTAPPTTAPPATTTTAPRNVATTVPGKVPVTTATTAVRPSSGAPATTAPPATTTTSVPANPSSWSVDQDGISVRLRIDPAVPRAGQSVRLIIDTSTTTGHYCCSNMVTLNGVDAPLPTGGASVDAQGAPITSTHEEQTWTVPASGWLNIRDDAVSLGGPPLSVTHPAQPVVVRLIASTPILP